jgi:hypothetical protein
VSLLASYLTDAVYMVQQINLDNVNVGEAGQYAGIPYLTRVSIRYAAIMMNSTQSDLLPLLARFPYSDVTA